MKFNEFVSVIHNKDKVIVGNRYNGQWIKISSEVYQYLTRALELGYTEEKFFAAFEQSEDTEYIKLLLNNMKMKNIIVDCCSEVRTKAGKISIELTNRCNLYCKHCCISANEYIEELTKNQMFELFDKVVCCNPNTIVLSGGEPLLRDDITELLEYLRNLYSGYITVCTNGLLINENNISILKKCTDQIDISIDGVDEESCKLIRGKGVFDKVIRNINLLKENGYEKITLSMMLTDKNATLEKLFYELNNKLGTKPIVRSFSAVGRGAENRNQLTNLSEGEVYISEGFYNMDKRLSFGGCKAGITNAFIRCNGDIYSCPLLGNDCYKIGNVFKMANLEKIFSSRNKNPLVDVIGKCKNCEVQPFCWACPAAIKEYIDNESIDNYCNKVKKTFIEKVWGDHK